MTGYVRVHARILAKAAGEKHYFDSKPCARGHIGPRYVSTYVCVECTKIRSGKRKGSPELREYRKHWMRRRREELRQTEEGRQKLQLEKRRLFDRIKADAERYESHKAKKLAYSMRYYKEHPDKVRAIQARRRAQKRQSGGSFTDGDVLALLSKQKGKCNVCLKKIKGNYYHVDHFIPLRLGGANTVENLQVLCPLCNLQKGGKDPYEYALELGRLVL